MVNQFSDKVHNQITLKISVLRSISMISYSQKFVCLYDKASSKHYLFNLQIQPLLVDSLDTNKKSIFQNQLFSKKGKTSFKDNTKFIDFTSTFQDIQLANKSDISFNNPKVYKQIFVPEFNRYFNFEELSNQQNCVPLQFTNSAILLLRLQEQEQQQQNSQKKQFSEQQQIKQKDLFNIQSQIKSNIPKIDIVPKIEYNQVHSEHKHEQLKDRDRSRTIGQIMNYVRKWRDLAENGTNGVKLNLQEAASLVGVPKKSLDDYYYQLRVGQKYNFQFDLNSDKNISVLRKFVKSKIPSRNKNQHKNIKIENSSHQKNSQDNQQVQKIPKKLKQYTKQQSKKTIPKSAPLYTLLDPPAQPEQSELIQTTTPLNPATNTIQSIDMDDENKSIGQVSNKFYKLSDSDVSSIADGWPRINTKNGDVIYDDDDNIFFNDFKYNDFNYQTFGRNM